MIAAHIAQLSKLPDHVRKLERRQAATQRSIEVKSKRINELEQEIERCVLYASEYGVVCSDGATSAD